MIKFNAHIPVKIYKFIKFIFCKKKKKRKEEKEKCIHLCWILRDVLLNGAANVWKLGQVWKMWQGYRAKKQNSMEQVCHPSVKNAIINSWCILYLLLFCFPPSLSKIRSIHCPCRWVPLLLCLEKLHNALVLTSHWLSGLESCCDGIDLPHRGPTLEKK